MTIGPVMLDLHGLHVDDEELTILKHPLVGGVILFSRNYESCEQLHELIAEIRDAKAEILIAVDHEGGRVQRFRDGFTKIPPMRCLEQVYADSAQHALSLAEQIGWLIAVELIAFDIDLSFAPVLDIDHGISEVIGDRAFSKKADVVTALAEAFIQGFHSAGMPATGKHFPGHGGVAADSHVAIPVDLRSFDEINAQDLPPFVTLSQQLDAVMPAHVIYEKVDALPAGFSPFWVQDILRKQLKFDGVVFSDDLTMEGACIAGGYPERAAAALDAGCDMVLVCNNRDGAKEVLNYLEDTGCLISHRLAKLRHKGLPNKELHSDPKWKETVAAISALNESNI